MEIAIRPATAGDLGIIRDIYNFYVERSTCTFQLDAETEADRLAWFAKRSPLHPATVAELGGEVVGWASLSPWHARCGYAHTVEISFYVREGWHRRGIGRALTLDLLERARAAGHHTVIGGACSEMAASIGLMESLGFERVAHLREVGRKFDRWLDVDYLQLFLGNE